MIKVTPELIEANVGLIEEAAIAAAGWEGDTWEEAFERVYNHLEDDDTQWDLSLQHDDPVMKAIRKIARPILKAEREV